MYLAKRSTLDIALFGHVKIEGIYSFIISFNFFKLDDCNICADDAIGTFTDDMIHIRNTTS